MGLTWTWPPKYVMFTGQGSPAGGAGGTQPGIGDGGVTGRHARIGGGVIAGRTTVLSPLIAAVWPIVYMIAGWWYGSGDEAASGDAAADTPGAWADRPIVPASARPGASIQMRRFTSCLLVVGRGGAGRREPATQNDVGRGKNLRARCATLFERMIKSSAQQGRPTRRGRARPVAADTPGRIIEATLSALGEHGYAATTARVIAARGGFPVGLIFYHFGTLDGLLLAVLDHTSAMRLPRWRQALASVRDVATLLDRLDVLYGEDVRSSHALAVKELVANGGFSQRLAPELAARMQPWFGLAEEVAARVLADSPLLAVLSARDLAVTAVSLYLGLETVARLCDEPASAERLFTAGRHLAPLLGHLGARSAGTGPRVRPTRVDID